jgi:trigger factor
VPAPGEAFTYTVRVEVKPEFELPDLTTIEAERPLVSVGDDEIDAEIERIRDQLAPLVEAEEGTVVAEGHTATIDFIGRVDGEAFEGGTGDGVDLEIGSGRFIPGFEEQLVGHAAGEKLDVNVTFPEEYGHEALAGKDAVFETTIQAVKHKQPPALDDEFAKDVGDFETLDDLKQRIRDDLTKQREEASREALNTSLMDSLLGKLDFEVPPGVVERQLRSHMESTHRQYHGRVPDEVLREQLMRIQEDGRGQAERRVREAFVLEAVARLHEVKIDEALLDERLGELAEAQGVSADKFRQTAQEQGWMQSIEAQLLDQAVFGFLAEQAQVSDVQPTAATSGGPGDDEA